MAGFRRWYRRRYPQRYRRYFRRYYRRYRRRFVNGSSRSSVRLKVPITTTATFTQGANTLGSNVIPLARPFGTSSSNYSALNSQLYRTYCSLYDEVKCIGVKMNLAVSTPIGTSEVPSLQIFSSWDRKRCSIEAPPSFNDLKTYSTFSSAVAVNNSVAKIQRTLYASDLFEKAAYHDCSLSLAGGVYSDAAYEAAGAALSFFNPELFVAVAVPNNTTDAHTINCTVEITFYYSFRNPKFGGSALSSKGPAVVMDAVDGGIDGNGDGDMDDIFDRFDAAVPVDALADEASQSQRMVNVDKRASSGTTIVTSKSRKRDTSDRPRAPRLN